MPNIVTLDEVRRHLRFPAADTADDASLQFHIDGATEAIEKECGACVPTQREDWHDGGYPRIFLRNKPVLSVEFVEEGWGTQNFTLDYVQSPAVNSQSQYAYSIDSLESGIVSRRTAGSIVIPFNRGDANIHVVYTSGRAPVPPVIKLATMELVAHWWQNGQQRAAATSGQFGYDATNQDFPRSGGLYTPINQGVPYRILEMIKKYRAEPIIG